MSSSCQGHDEDEIQFRGMMYHMISKPLFCPLVLLQQTTRVDGSYSYKIFTVEGTIAHIYHSINEVFAMDGDSSQG